MLQGSIDNLELLVELPIKAAEDTHFRVRWAAINAIEEFSNDLKPEFQLQYYQQVLPALSKALNLSMHPCIQVQAASSLFYFSKHCTSDQLTPYMDEIVHNLLRCIQKGNHLLEEEALTAAASLASSAEDWFQEHYRNVMPYLRVVMMKAAAESDSILLLKSLECITLVGVAIGKEKFSDYIQMVVQLLISLQESELKIEDLMRNQVLLVCQYYYFNFF
ncbi:importin subunit beta-3-like [Manihot esculenta]|uniref:importin subunit beta-3-like n=1 Tax=Manihot esculenta TaxID=3983 RepID=UPI001CC4B605|nr:importin subunit beta-3-like [Manihot esculenta]